MWERLYSPIPMPDAQPSEGDASKFLTPEKHVTKLYVSESQKGEDANPLVLRALRLSGQRDPFSKRGAALDVIEALNVIPHYQLSFRDKRIVLRRSINKQNTPTPYTADPGKLNYNEFEKMLKKPKPIPLEKESLPAKFTKAA